jgi:NTP pyrophosphatase (non-canonical NTP hydrolase)
MNPRLGFSIGSEVCPGLSKLVEECGEVLQIAGKLIATGGNPFHWDGSCLTHRMTEELADLRAAILFYCEANGHETSDFAARVQTKLELFREWHAKQASEAHPGCVVDTREGK